MEFLGSVIECYSRKSVDMNLNSIRSLENFHYLVNPFHNFFAMEFAFLYQRFFILLYLVIYNL